MSLYVKDIPGTSPQKFKGGIKRNVGIYQHNSKVPFLGLNNRNEEPEHQNQPITAGFSNQSENEQKHWQRFQNYGEFLVYQKKCPITKPQLDKGITQSAVYGQTRSYSQPKVQGYDNFSVNEPVQLPTLTRNEQKVQQEIQEADIRFKEFATNSPPRRQNSASRLASSQSLQNPYNQGSSNSLTQNISTNTKNTAQNSVKREKILLITDMNSNLLKNCQQHISGLLGGHHNLEEMVEIVSIPGGATGIINNKNLRMGFFETISMMTKEFNVSDIYVFSFLFSPYIKQYMTHPNAGGDVKTEVRELMSFQMKNVFELKKVMREFGYSDSRIKGYMVDSKGRIDNL